MNYMSSCKQERKTSDQKSEEEITQQIGYVAHRPFCLISGVIARGIFAFHTSHIEQIPACSYAPATIFVRDVGQSELSAYVDSSYTRENSSRRASARVRLMPVLSVLEPLGPSSGTCGYCSEPGKRSKSRSSYTIGAWCHQISCDVRRMTVTSPMNVCSLLTLALQVYQRMIDR